MPVLWNWLSINHIILSVIASLASVSDWLDFAATKFDALSTYFPLQTQPSMPRHERISNGRIYDAFKSKWRMVIRKVRVGLVAVAEEFFGICVQTKICTHSTPAAMQIKWKRKRLTLYFECNITFLLWAPIVQLNLCARALFTHTSRCCCLCDERKNNTIWLHFYSPSSVSDSRLLIFITFIFIFGHKFRMISARLFH